MQRTTNRSATQADETSKRQTTMGQSNKTVTPKDSDLEVTSSPTLSATRTTKQNTQTANGRYEMRNSSDKTTESVATTTTSKPNSHNHTNKADKQIMALPTGDENADEAEHQVNRDEAKESEQNTPRRHDIRKVTRSEKTANQQPGKNLRAHPGGIIQQEPTKRNNRGYNSTTKDRQQQLLRTNGWRAKSTGNIQSAEK